MNILTKKYVAVVFCLFLNCSQENSTFMEAYDLFQKVNSEHSGIDFSNIIAESAQSNIMLYDYFYNGGGAAIGDIDNDGLPDIFFSGNQVPNKLYLNLGELRFEDVTEKAGIYGSKWSTGVSMIDINRDGFLDIYVCNSGPDDKEGQRRNDFFINQKNGRFINKAKEMGLDNDGGSTQASFFDLDKDGDLDVFILNHSFLLNLNIADFNNLEREINDGHPDLPSLSRESSALYENLGDGVFKDISANSGIQRIGFGLGVITADFNNDNWPDIYIANDFQTPDFLYINQKDGTFKDQIHLHTRHTPFYSMGCDYADVDNDGFQDLLTLDMASSDHIRSKTLMPSMNTQLFQFLKDVGYHHQQMFNSLQLNNGNSTFRDIGLFAGLAKTEWSWAALLADFNNDGLKDAFVTNGFRRDTKNNDWREMEKESREKAGGTLTSEESLALLKKAPSTKINNLIFENKNGYEFKDKTRKWGLSIPSFSNGAAYGDLDLDGDLDLVVNNIDDKAFLFENQSDKSKKNYLQIELFSQKPTTNTKVWLHTKENRQLVEHLPVRGFQSSVEPIIHFGLGEHRKIDSIVVQWPDASRQTIEKPSSNQRLKISKKSSTHQPKEVSPLPLFVNLRSSQPQFNFRHQENDFNDFEREILLPHRLSKQGPKLALGDINNDGLDDVYVCGASGQSGKLYLQNDAGFLLEMLNTPWDKYKNREETDALFFDLENDGDQDLYIVSGGNDSPDGQYSDQLYINTGQGFADGSDKLPSMNSSGSCVRTADIDNDGDLDLFIGSRQIPGKYPFIPKSHLLIWNGDRFDEVTHQYFENSELGLLTDALFTDFDNDGLKDLILVGEWMPISFYRNTGEAFQRITQASLENSHGLWYSIAEGDLDQDGDSDFVIGNLGKNSKFKASISEPLHIFCNDFDENGTNDIVLSNLYKSQLVPVRGRECSSDQMPFIEAKFPTYQSFAEASLEDIYGSQKLDEAVHLQSKTFESIILRNDGNGSFSVETLPLEAQFAPINAIEIVDLFGDSRPEIIVAGNMYETEVETPRYDSGTGTILTFENGAWRVLPISKTGIYAPMNVKDMKYIELGREEFKTLIFANNDNLIQIFTLNPDAQLN